MDKSYRKAYSNGTRIVVDRLKKMDGGFFTADVGYVYSVKFYKGNKVLIRLNVDYDGPYQPEKVTALGRRMYKEIQQRYPLMNYTKYSINVKLIDVEVWDVTFDDAKHGSYFTSFKFDMTPV